MNSEINKAIALPEVRQRLPGFGLDPVGGSAAEFGGHIRGELVRWTKVIKASGIRTD